MATKVVHFVQFDMVDHHINERQISRRNLSEAEIPKYAVRYRFVNKLIIDNEVVAIGGYSEWEDVKK